jgi:hypothetical protein
MGRSVIVVDWSVSADRPVLVRYDAENLISWSTSNEGGDERLVRAVLKEEFLEEQRDGTLKPGCRYREYRLDDVATVTLWTRTPGRELRDPSEERYTAQPPTTLTRRGEPLTFIPMVIFGAWSLGVQVERPPMLDLADKAVEYWQTSADHRHALHYLGCPTAVIAGESLAGGTEDKITIGPSVVIRLAQGGQWGLLSMSDASIAPLRNALVDVRAEMATLGARLLEGPAVYQTATSVALRYASDNATLQAVAQTVERAVEQALRVAVWWAGREATPANTAVSFELNKDVTPMGATVQEVQTLLAAYQASAISFPTFYEAMAKRGLTREGVDAVTERAEIDRAGEGAMPNGTDDELKDDAAIEPLQS